MKTRRLKNKDPLGALITRREAVAILQEAMRHHVLTEHRGKAPVAQLPVAIEQNEAATPAGIVLEVPQP